MLWANPDGRVDFPRYHVGALHAAVVDGRVLLAGMFCSLEWSQRVELRDTTTGEVLDVHDEHRKFEWHDPVDHFSSFSVGDASYVAFLTHRPHGFTVLQITSSGFERVCHRTADHWEDDVIGVGPVVLDDAPALLVAQERTVTWRAWPDCEQVLRYWNSPPGWEEPRLMVFEEKVWALLSATTPDDAPASGRPRIFPTQLWDLTADVPIGSPMPMNGRPSGPWVLDARPVALCRIGHDDAAVWDIGRCETIGPGLRGPTLQVVSPGVLYGRPALAVADSTWLHVFDLGTGVLVGSRALPDTAIAATFDPSGTVWAITETGRLTRLQIPVGNIHPVALRRRGSTSKNPHTTTSPTT